MTRGRLLPKLCLPLLLQALACGGRVDEPAPISSPEPVSTSGFPSCLRGLPGASARCGASGSLDCCETLP
nr:hypothetical protein [Polyangiaceae bacterium]